jgi:hypothetical protein
MVDQAMPSVLAALILAIALALPTGAAAQQSSSAPDAANNAADGSSQDAIIRWAQIQQKAKTFQANRSGPLMSPTVSKPQDRFKKALEKAGKTN